MARKNRQYVNDKSLLEVDSQSSRPIERGKRDDSSTVVLFAIERPGEAIYFWPSQRPRFDPLLSHLPSIQILKVDLIQST